MLSKADKIIGHNIIGFDLPALSKLYNFYPPLVQVQDTLVMSRCLNQDLKEDDFSRKNFDTKMIGSHSLKAWGLRMGEILKLSYGEEEGAWDSYNEDMKKYCERDVIVTKTLYEYLINQNPSKKMLAVEHWFAYIIRLQESKGFEFDVDKAEQLEQKLNTVSARLKDELQKMFEPKVEQMKSSAGWSLKIEHMDGVEIINAPTKAKLKDILKKRGMVQNLVKDAESIGTQEKVTPFNPGSRLQIKERFKELGIELPVSNDGETVKVDEATLKKISHPAAELLLEYLLVVKRLGQLADGKNGWLKLVKNGRIHGRVNTNGAVTGRCTHSSPNLAQVPAGRVPYGEECRSLFIAKSGYKLVGCDASGLELRMLAHYLANWDGGEYARNILEGDIHTVNQKAIM